MLFGHSHKYIQECDLCKTFVIGWIFSLNWNILLSLWDIIATNQHVVTIYLFPVMISNLFLFFWLDNAYLSRKCSKKIGLASWIIYCCIIIHFGYSLESNTIHISYHIIQFDILGKKAYSVRNSQRYISVQTTINPWIVM